MNYSWLILKDHDGFPKLTFKKSTINNKHNFQRKLQFYNHAFLAS